jgi:hypothetical protein
VHDVHVSATNEDWKRLAAYIKDRRDALDMTQGDVRAAGGPSVTTLQKLELAARTAYRRGTLTAVDRALKWRPGSSRAILKGDEPTPLDDRTPAETDSRLGGQLIRRRILLGDELSRNYRDRFLFAAERGIDYDLAYRAEHGELEALTEDEQQAVQRAYGLAGDSLEPGRSLTTGIPELASSTEGAHRAYVRAALEDRQFTEAHWRIVADQLRMWRGEYPQAAPAKVRRRA